MKWIVCPYTAPPAASDVTVVLVSARLTTCVIAVDGLEA
jgi:hypothetical protein